MVDFEIAQHFVGDERVKEIEERLDDYDMEQLLEIYQYANSYDGSFEFSDVFSIENFDEKLIQMTPYEVFRATFYGNVKCFTDWLRFNVYDNLESLSDAELKKEIFDNTSELAWWIVDYGPDICLGLAEEDYDLINRWDDIDRESKK